MAVRRSFAHSWLVLASAAAFVAGASAQGTPPRSQGVVTPDDPIFAQEPAPNPPSPTPPAPETPETPDPQTAPAQAPATPPAAPGATGRGRGGRPLTYTQFRSDAKTDDGIFKVHRVRDSVFFEIPKKELGKDFLWVSQIKRTTIGAGFGGQEFAERVVRWDLTNDRVFLKTIDYSLVADSSKPMAQAVADANVPAIVRGFTPVVTSPEGNPVVDVTGLFLGDVAEFSPRTRLGARGMDQTRSYLDKVVSFPENINAQLTMTYTSAAGAGEPGTGGRGRGGLRGSSGTIVVFHSIVKLPEKPMMPRLADARVGYFSTSMYDYGRDENKSVERSYITRYRLEKKDPDAAISDPVKPIVYYVDPATPTKLIPWIKKGVEAWRPAFEAAGFSNAIEARDAPTREDDPDWDAEDVRYSVIRWLPSTEENAMGPHVADPRSGEILEADVQVYHNVQNLATMWYFTQVGALDPRAQKLPLPDELLGQLVQFVVSHEIGHTLGFQHNMKASSLYTVAQVRDKNWVKENGHTPTLMDYARFNYVAQPEDGIAVEDLVPKIGPSDKWATMWGYKPIPSAKTPDEEKATLNDWAREQETKPYLRFTTSNSLGTDPGEQTEAVGDADPVVATELGLRNLKKVAGMLVTATARPGEPYDDLTEVYGRVVTQWRLELGHVVNVIGGVDSRELYVGQDGPRFVPITKPRQTAALQFLIDNAFQPPQFLLNTDLLRRIEPSGVVTRIGTAHRSLMNSLLSSARLNRMVEQGALDPLAYTPLQFLADLRRGVWRELSTPAAAVGLYRRNVQRVYIDTIDERINGLQQPGAEAKSLLRGELRAVDQQIASALPAVADVATKRHLEDARERIRTVLDPRAMRDVAVAVLTIGGGRGANAAVSSKRTLVSSEPYDYNNDPFLMAPDSCFADITIR